MFAPGVHGWPSAGCPGCSMFVDNFGQFAVPHLSARAAYPLHWSRSPFASLEAYRKRTSWPHRWVSSANNNFNVDLGMTTPSGETHGLSVLLRRGDEISAPASPPDADARRSGTSGVSWTQHPTGARRRGRIRLRIGPGHAPMNGGAGTTNMSRKARRSLVGADEPQAGSAVRSYRGYPACLRSVHK